MGGWPRQSLNNEIRVPLSSESALADELEWVFSFFPTTNGCLHRRGSVDDLLGVGVSPRNPSHNNPAAERRLLSHGSVPCALSRSAPNHVKRTNVR